MSNAKIVTYKGITYPSLSALAKAFNISNGTLRYRLKNGISLENKVSNKKIGIVITYKGVTYPNGITLAKKFNINPTTFYRRIQKGYSIEKALSQEKLKPRSIKAQQTKYAITYNGVDYPNLSSLAKAFNINAATLQQRLSRGYSLEDALSNKRINKIIMYNGVKYTSYSALAKAHNITRQTLWNRIKQGYSLDEALSQKRLRNPNSGYGTATPISYKGIKYRTKKELANALNVTPSFLYQRLSKGLSVEEALLSVEKVIVGKPVTYKGVKYPSIKELAKAVNVKPDFLYQRFKKGYTVEEALLSKDKEKTFNGKIVTYKGVKYPSIKELAKSLNIKPEYLYRKRGEGYTVEEALSPEKMRSKKSKKAKKKKIGKAFDITYKGVTYATRKELADAYNIDLIVLYYRLAKGWSLEDAINTKVSDGE